MRTNRRQLIAGALAAPIVLQHGFTKAQSSPWTVLDQSGSGPSPRWDHALFAGDASKRLYLFGGRDGAGSALGDTWAYALNQPGWTAVESAGPAARFGSAAATLPDGSGFLLFGGQSESKFYNDLWQFDFASGQWQLLDDGSTVAPSPRYGLGGAFDDKGRFVVSHGFTFEGRFDDTWAYDPEAGAWADISPPAESRPLRRCLHEVQAVDGTSLLLLYAGCSSGYGPCPQGDLWAFDATADTWTQLFPDVVPAARSNPALTSNGNTFLLVGGLTEAGPTSDVWTGTFDGSAFAWTENTAASGAIVPRSSHDMVRLGPDYYLFGGLGIEGALNDLWRFSTES